MIWIASSPAGEMGAYRVKREGDGQEQAVSEFQLVKVTQELRTGGTAIETQRNANALGQARSAARRH